MNNHDDSKSGGNSDGTVVSANFIHDEIIADLKPDGRFAGETVHTRFPPEPNGYLHIGHAKAIVINFSTAEKFGGLCNLRMDDTNPSKEETEYVDSIREDIHWLGYDWGDRFYYASDYFPVMFDFACRLIEKGLAYICELSAEQIRSSRGTLKSPGTASPYRDRPVEESLDLFKRMRAGEFSDGAMTLRAKIDMASGNINMRDPVLYRISRAHHHRTGDQWCVYPMYDFAHPIEDAVEGITHSLCSIEFEDHRPLYDWVINAIDGPAKPRQIEFARLNLSQAVTSKRKVRQLVEAGIISGWDDPRVSTLSGLRRRGYTPESIRSFCHRIGVSKVYSTVDYAFLEHCLREDLNSRAPRVMAVIEPVKLIIDNYPADKCETFEIENNPEQPADGNRTVTFSRELWIEADDFREEAVKKFFRLFPGQEVRLKTAYVIRCTGCDKDADGNITAVHAEYDPDTRGGSTPDGRKIKGTIHWVDSRNAVDAEVRLYADLYAADPDNAAEPVDDLATINPESLIIHTGSKVEASLAGSKAPSFFQFLRLGYFCLDYLDSQPEKLVFNRSVSLRDSWKKHS